MLRTRVLLVCQYDSLENSSRMLMIQFLLIKNLSKNWKNHDSIFANYKSDLATLIPQELAARSTWHAISRASTKFAVLFLTEVWTNKNKPWFGTSVKAKCTTSLPWQPESWTVKFHKFSATFQFSDIGTFIETLKKLRKQTVGSFIETLTLLYQAVQILTAKNPFFLRHE